MTVNTPHSVPSILLTPYEHRIKYPGTQGRVTETPTPAPQSYQFHKIKLLATLPATDTSVPASKPACLPSSTEGLRDQTGDSMYRSAGQRKALPEHL